MGPLYPCEVLYFGPLLMQEFLSAFNQKFLWSLMLLNVFFTSVWIFILEKDCLHEEKLSFAKHWKGKQNMNVSYAKKNWSRKLSLWYNTIFETLKLLVMGSCFLWNETSSCSFESFIIRFFGIACLLQLNV